MADLIDAMCDDDPPATARQQIQTCVWNLRKSLTIGGDGRGYHLPVAPGKLDAQVFVDAARRCNSG